MDSFSSDSGDTLDKLKSQLDALHEKAMADFNSSISPKPPSAPQTPKASRTANADQTLTGNDYAAHCKSRKTDKFSPKKPEEFNTDARILREEWLKQDLLPENCTQWNQSRQREDEILDKYYELGYKAIDKDGSAPNYPNSGSQKYADQIETMKDAYRQGFRNRQADDMEKRGQTPDPEPTDSAPRTPQTTGTAKQSRTALPTGQPLRFNNPSHEEQFRQWMADKKIRMDVPYIDALRRKWALMQGITLEIPHYRAGKDVYEPEYRLAADDFSAKASNTAGQSETLIGTDYANHLQAQRNGDFKPTTEEEFNTDAKRIMEEQFKQKMAVPNSQDQRDSKQREQELLHHYEKLGKNAHSQGSATENYPHTTNPKYRDAVNRLKEAFKKGYRENQPNS